MIFFLKKNWMWVAIGAVAILFLPRLISLSKKLFGVGESLADTAVDLTNKVTGKGFKDDQADLVKDFEAFRESVQPTGYTKSQSFYEGLALELYNGMQSLTPATWSVSEQSFKTLESLNGSDLLMLWKQFGLKKNTYLIIGDNGSGDLIFWFKHELEGAWGDKLERMAKIWKDVNWKGTYLW